MKETFDPRGRQSSIFRLAAFDKEGLLHAVTIRILTFVALVAAAVMLLNLWLGIFTSEYKLLLVVVWVLITPQLFELATGMAMMATRGMVFGHLNKAWLDSVKYRDKRNYSLYEAVPYVVLVIWLGLFAALVGVWFA